MTWKRSSASRSKSASSPGTSERLDRARLAREPDKIALPYIADGDPDGGAVCLSYRELQPRRTQAANLFHSLGVTPDDAVLFLLPTVPQLYIVMLGALAAGIACSVNWMLKPEQLVELVALDAREGRSSLGPTPGFEIWENVQAIRERHSAGRAHSDGARAGRRSHARIRSRYARRTRSPADRLHVRAHGKRARRHRGLYPLRRHDRLAQAREAHPSRLRLQVLGQRGGDGAHAPTM